MPPHIERNNDIKSLVQLLKDHETSHTAQKKRLVSHLPEKEPNTLSVEDCTRLLRKLQSILPKMLKTISSLESTFAPETLGHLCELLMMLLKGTVCPHIYLAFITPSSKTARDDAVEGDYGSSIGLVNFGTLYLYLVSFYCNRMFKEIRFDLLAVLEQFGLLLQQYDPFALAHIFEDTMVSIEECFHYKKREVGRKKCVLYPNTAIHMFRTADGLLRQRNRKEVLCGCRIIGDTAERNARALQLEKLLPSMELIAGPQVADLRELWESYAITLIQNHSTIVSCGRVSRRQVLQLCKVLYHYEQTQLDNRQLYETTLSFLYAVLTEFVSSDQALVEFGCFYFDSTRWKLDLDYGINTHLAIFTHLERSICNYSMSQLLWKSFDKWLLKLVESDIVKASRYRETAKVWIHMSIRFLQQYIDSNGPLSNIAKHRLITVFEIIRPELSNDDKIVHDMSRILHRTFGEDGTFIANFMRFLHTNLRSGAFETKKRKRETMEEREKSCTFDSFDQKSSEIHVRLANWFLVQPGQGSSNALHEANSFLNSFQLLGPICWSRAGDTITEAKSVRASILKQFDKVTNELSKDITDDGLYLMAMNLTVFLFVADDMQLQMRADSYSRILSLMMTRTNLNTQSSVGTTWKAMCEMAPVFRRLAKAEVPPMPPTCLSYLLLPYLVWMRYKALQGLVSLNWKESLPLLGSCGRWTLDSKPNAQLESIIYCPLLVLFLVREDVASPEEIAEYLLERIRLWMDGNEKLTAQTRTMLCKTVCAVVCLAFSSVEKTTHIAADGVMSGCILCHSKETSRLKLTNYEVFKALVEVTHVEEDTEAAMAKTELLCTIFRHLEMSLMSTEDLRNLVHIFLLGLSFKDSATQEHVLGIIGLLPDSLTYLDPVSRDHKGFGPELVALFQDLLTSLEKEIDPSRLIMVVRAIGVLCRSCDISNPIQMELLLLLMLQLVVFWNYYQWRPEVASIFYNQIKRTESYHKLSWRRLCMKYPQKIYVPLIGELLKSKAICDFLHTFLNDSIDPATFLLASAPHTLSKYVAEQDEEQLQRFQLAMNEYQGIKSGSAESEDSNQSDPLAISDLILNHIEYILKELIMQQIEHIENGVEVTTWEFLFRYLPANTTIRDVILHSPMRLVNLLVWEFGAERSETAKRAFTEVLRYIHQGNSIEANVDDPRINTQQILYPISRHYFLAIMTDLSIKISSKDGLNEDKSSIRLRAVTCVGRLLECLLIDKRCMKTAGQGTSSSEFVDPFVPKIMATLKLLWLEGDMNLKQRGIRVWTIFVQLLSDKALGSNILAILVNTLPYLALEADTSASRFHLASHENNNQLEEYIQSTKHSVLGLLKYIFVSKRSELRGSFPRVPILPKIPELDDVQNILEEEVGDSDSRRIEDFINDLIRILKHWDSSVRELALNEVYQCLTRRQNDMQGLIQRNFDPFIHGTVAELMATILRLTKTETKTGNKLLCAKCLGAIGAIDAAYMPSNMSSSLISSSKQAGVEYTTKELACVLIEPLIVNELRAAPDNTDSLAFAIQELLRFLGELNAGPDVQGSDQSGERGSLPGWIKDRFESSDVLQYIEPYWSTCYTISASSSSSYQIALDSEDRKCCEQNLTFYEKCGATYEDWVTEWCKRLVQLSQPPEQKIFWASRTALSSCPQIARFLLPYLIQNVLRTGNSQVYQEVKREIMSVITNQDQYHETCFDTPVHVDIGGASSQSQYEDSAPNYGLETFNDYQSRHHQCAQSLFSTLDELNDWVWAQEKKRNLITNKPDVRTPKLSEPDDQEKENLEEFLKDIPSRLLSNAAYSVRAFARAVQYFEVHLRQQSNGTANKLESHANTLDSSPVHLSVIMGNISYLQLLYSSVNETDALVGLATIRRINQAESDDAHNKMLVQSIKLTDLLYQIVDYEQLAQWEDALACYEQALQQIHALPTQSEIDDISELQFGDKPYGETKTLRERLYGGTVRCLIQLGRLESALQQINGIVSTEPSFMETLHQHALECTWRLSRWELLSDLLQSDKNKPSAMDCKSTPNIKTSDLRYVPSLTSRKDANGDTSHIKFVRVLHNLHMKDAEALSLNLSAARLEIMGPLAAALGESYQRAYPLLHRLHFLHEVEQGFAALSRVCDVPEESKRAALWKSHCNWESRYNLIANSLRFRDPILALRRLLVAKADLADDLSSNWLQYAKLARKEGFIRTATNAVMHAELLCNPSASIERAKLLIQQNRMYEALQTIEPVEIDTTNIEFDAGNPKLNARRLLLATNWMQASGLRQGKQVIERYRAVIRLNPTCEKGYFHLAKYFEYLLGTAYPNIHLNDSRPNDTFLGITSDDAFHQLLINLMRNYISTLKHGTKYIYQALPRLLTLWFEYGELLYAGASKNSKAMRQLDHAGLRESNWNSVMLSDISQLIDEATEILPGYVWLAGFPQVLSRICHPNPEVVEGVKKIIVKVLTHYPAQSMWPIVGLSRSLNAQRRNRSRECIAYAQRAFIDRDDQDNATSFSEVMRLAEELISLAAHDPQNQRKMHVRLSRIRTKVLLPIQANLTASFLNTKQWDASSERKIYIIAFADKADVLMTKEKPKRIEILASDGHYYPFLCKREKTGDLRKDARMMEFNNMINKFLQKDADAKKRKLRLRTYAVVCLNEESGLMEWVQETRAMRQLISQTHKTELGFLQPFRLTHEIRDRFLAMQKKYTQDTKLMAIYFQQKILTLPVFKPRFHQWFHNNFSDPTAWFEARSTFTRSTAVWSMVGHIIGLGDRHGENILVDCTNGECVHVDFDCLFDKGLKLAKPEIVPFRLTPNMIDAFGIMGYEGVFRCVSEIIMRLLRNNRDALKNVLESFIHDPLVEWGRRGKGGQGSMSSNTIPDISSERSKEETRIILKTIDDRLRGIYNLGDAIRPLVSPSQRRMLPENEGFPLSVQGQVDKLIQEATSTENLAQMYIGWMPFL
uniref:Serine/threonine-protein kinase ATR n=1 Tax=Albugo laibachii Nc14 TaxID=890382 RepID=F0WKD9_9STRA|nr:phosphatidylinositol kinase (PIKL4) putative [Albugo laibachii Nc14]|eukprot:CCA21743.1 phosphatidylinositol kinase (PIKL4) putative [Albugo laibachii Nc14]